MAYVIARKELTVLDTHTGRLLTDQSIGETPVDVAPDRSGVWVATFVDETRLVRSNLSGARPKIGDPV